MRLLVLGALGPYPERISSFVEDNHQVWYVSMFPLPDGDELAGTRAMALYELPGYVMSRRAEANAACSTGGPGAPDWPDPVEAVLQLIEAERIDAVYSLLNIWDGSTELTADLLRRGCPVPLIRHYKEHYMWPRDDERASIELATGVIFISEESRRHFASLYRLPRRTACWDADLLPRRYLAGGRRPKLSALDGRPHILIAGTAMDDGGRYDYRELIGELVGMGAHVHLYGNFRAMQPSGLLYLSAEVEMAYRAIDGRCREYLHIHALIPPARFVEEWSAYDAGLLHVPRREDAFRVLNIPNRYSAYLAAGVPVAIPRGEMPAMQRRLETLNAAVVYDGPADLVRQLPSPEAADAAFAAREQVTFESVYPGIIRFIESCIEA